MKKLLKSPVTSVLLFFLAAILLLGSAVGSTRAALSYYSENYTSRVEMDNIGVSLLENGTKVSWRDYSNKSDGTWNEATGVLLEHMLTEGEEFRPGTVYPEELAVTNSGTIDQYVRVRLYKYWMDEKGNKLPDLSPDLIDLNLVNVGTDWLIDEASATPERTVLYYKNVLAAGATTPLLSDTLSVDAMLSARVSQTTVQTGNTTTVQTTYEYDGVQFWIEARVDAVQTHNAKDAIRSAWGCEADVSEDGTLHLQNQN